ncbi:MAG: proline/glycine betaine ABC transporter permease [SAR202 cluster bacterium]|nr:proline/glycine betaine ABC transporter permease [SAR202 cluster bacterium]
MNAEPTMDYPTNVGPEISNAIDDSIDWTIVNLNWFFDGISDNLKVALGKLRDFLIWIPWPVFVSLVFLIGWRMATFRIGIASALGMMAIGLVNLWEPAMVTVAIMMVAVSIAIVIGVPIGVLAARNNLVDTITRPILDAMQTMPSFVYLVPGIMLFGLGNVAAILATVLYAIPPCIRLTNLGIRQVDPSVVEAGRSFGSSPLQLLIKVQIPMAIPTIMAGINQTVMMALAMATIAAMVGAGGLGIEVLRSMGQLEEGRAFVAGAAIVVMAIIIDRISQGYVVNRDDYRSNG